MQTMRLTKIFLALLIVLTMFSCRKDSSDPTTTTNIPPFEVVNSYTIDVQGLVTTPDGNPVENAIIKVQNQEVVTTEAGSFYVKNLVAPESGLFLLADAEGYFKGGSTVYSHSNNKYTVNITLIPFDQLISFDTGSGLDYVSDDGAKLKIEPNSVVDENGSPYSGAVDTYLYWIDPSAADMPALSPGPLVGLLDDEIQNLRSYGMIGVEMYGSGGQALNIAEGKNASLSFPLPTAFISEAPGEIELWHFNENTGLWDIEGSATLVNGAYEASVPHFSWWNCDIPTEYGQLCFNIVDESGRPLGNVDLELVSGEFGCASAFVDGTGVYCNLAPLGEELTLNLYSFCGEILISETIPPLSSGGSITVEIPLGSGTVTNLNISGNVSCGAAGPVTNGLVIMKLGNKPYLDYLDDQGNYSINFIACAQGPYEATVTAFDLDELTNGAEVVFVDDEDIVLDIDGCNEDLGEQTMILSQGNTGQVYAVCEANVTPAEVTIVALIEEGEIAESIILGIDGFGVGDFTGNLIGNVSGTSISVEEQGLVSISITSYSDVPGEKIAGSFSFDDVSGTFIAEVQ